MTGTSSDIHGARESAPLLEIRGLRKQFGGLAAVSGLDFSIPKGSIVALIGPNGAGKTTVFNIITGLYRPTSGSIVFDGRDITHFKPHQIVHSGIGRTFQNIRLFPNMSVLDNVLVGVTHTLGGSWWQSFLGVPHSVQEDTMAVERAHDLLAMPGLDLLSRETEYARNLPYGDQRRLEIARALATGCRLLLLDEPTAGMNPGETLHLTTFVRSIRDRLGLTILLIEHDMRVVMTLSERVTVLDRGERIAEGTPDEVRADRRVIEAYLGRAASGGN